MSNYADDDQLLNTGVSYPIAFNDRFPYVTISRASDDAGIHTNNRETLGQRLATDTIKTAAVTFDEKGFGTANELSVASYFDSTILDN